MENRLMLRHVRNINNSEHPFSISLLWTMFYSTSVDLGPNLRFPSKLTQDTMLSGTSSLLFQADLSNSLCTCITFCQPLPKHIITSH